jgi:hypothetical protein
MRIMKELFLNWADYVEARGLVRSLAYSRGRRALTSEVRDDLGTLGLVLLGLVRALVEKGVISDGELRAQLRRLGEAGAADVSPDEVRGALGLEPKRRRATARARRKRR